MVIGYSGMGHARGGARPGSAAGCDRWTHGKRQQADRHDATPPPRGRGAAGVARTDAGRGGWSWEFVRRRVQVDAAGAGSGGEAELRQ